MRRFCGFFISGLAHLALSVSAVAHANEQAIEIFATAWGDTLAQDGRGFYNEIAADILEAVSGSETYRIMPYRRAKQQFFASGRSCLYPSSLPGLASAGQIKNPENFIESDGIFAAKTHLFVRADASAPTSLSEIAGKTIAYPNGSVAVNALFGNGASLIGVNSEQDKAQMLIADGWI